jgi:hypothetical protein
MTKKHEGQVLVERAHPLAVHEARERAAGDRQPTDSFLVGGGSPASRGLADGGISCAS